ncbi:MAG: YkvA family protein [Chloroflexota bacterium]|nr:YkvA family protein [Chloroflexota bacterium]
MPINLIPDFIPVCYADDATVRGGRSCALRSVVPDGTMCASMARNCGRPRGAGAGCQRSIAEDLVKIWARAALDTGPLDQVSARGSRVDHSARSRGQAPLSSRR